MKEIFKVLIADRNRNIREFLQRELRTEGYKVLLACDARQVAKIMEIEAPDLLILDLDHYVYRTYTTPMPPQSDLSSANISCVIYPTCWISSHNLHTVM